MHQTLVAALLAAALTASALGQGTNFRVRQIAQGDASLTVLAFAPGDSSRLFVGRLNGVVRILDLPQATWRETPFVTLPGGSTINGLLNLTFDPRDNGWFYASKQDGDGFVTLYRGKVSDADPSIADPASITKVFSRFGAGGQHTGGMLIFDADGSLYLTSGDQSGQPQSLDTWGGKVFRIDVDGPDNIPGNEDDDAFAADADNNYSIPPDNPYVGVAGAKPEIWARGLRNPYRASRDSETGDIWIGDVGGSNREEISIMPSATPGMNFGWPTFEGFRCNSTAAACTAIASTPPLLDYPHSDPALISGSAVIGGTVYRGCSMPFLDGTYVFADLNGRWIATVREKNGATLGLTSRQSPMNPGGVVGFSCFAADPRGELFVCTYFSGRIYAIEASVARDCNGNGTPDGCEGLPVCLADYDGSCAVEIDDLTGYLGAFEVGLLAADYDDGTGEGLIDGAVGIEDLLEYLRRFEAGC